jgi:hypothetical protein
MCFSAHGPEIAAAGNVGWCIVCKSSLSKPLIAPSALLRLAADVVPTVGFFVIDEYFGVVMYSNYQRGHVVPSEFGKEKHETLEN